jgi:predicted membrane protein
MQKLRALLKDREWVIFAILAVGVVLWATRQRDDQFTAIDAVVLVVFACAVAAAVLFLVQFIVRKLQE